MKKTFFADYKSLYSNAAGLQIPPNGTVELTTDTVELTTDTAELTTDD